MPGTSIKITEIQKKKVDELVKELDYLYRSRNDFVVKAVNKEIEYATLLKDFDDSQRILFNDLLRFKRLEAYKEIKYLSIEQKIEESHKRTEKNIVKG